MANICIVQLYFTLKKSLKFYGPYGYYGVTRFQNELFINETLLLIKMIISNFRFVKDGPKEY